VLHSTKYLFLLSGVVKFRELLANTRFFSIGLKEFICTLEFLL